MNTLPKNYTYQEIMSQPEIWQATIDNNFTDIENIRTWLETPRENVLFTGCGSTHYLSLYAAAVWQALTKENTRGLPASELYLFPELYLTKTTSLLVAISRSAITSETLRALNVFQDRIGKNNIAITCYPERQLSKAAKHMITAPQAAEQSVVQTRSFSSMAIMADFLAGIAAQRNDFIKEITSLPTIAERLINNYEKVFERVGRNLEVDHFIFLGSGANYGIACEAMIKMKEMTLTHSEAFHFLEFRHGPKAIIDTNVVVVGVMSDSARNEEAAVLSEMRELGAYVIALDDSGDNLNADEIIPLHSGVGELLRGILALPLLQLLAYHRALAKNLDPDHPKNLSSVVHLG